MAEHPCYGILHSNKKEQSIATCYNIDESQKSKWKLHMKEYLWYDLCVSVCWISCSLSV